MKRLVAFLTAMVIVLTFSACSMNLEEQRTKYTVTFSVYIQNEVSEQSCYSSDDIASLEQMRETYISIIRSDTVLNQVKEKVDTTLTTDQLRKMVSVTSLSDTEVFKIAVTADRQQLAMDIAQAIAQVISEEFPRIIKDCTVVFIDSPHTKKNTSLWNLFR